MITLEVKELCFDIDNKKLLKDISLEIESGTMVGLIGPNGSGKSTLLKNIYRVLKPTGGCIYIEDKRIQELTNKEVAKRMAVVSQDDIATGFDFKVIDIILMGRYAHKSLFDSNNHSDIEVALKALRQVEMEEYYDRNFLSLSGGEKQRVMIARAICQQSNILIMDEPTNHLDIKHQLNIIEYIKSLKLTTFIAIHDINIAATFCDKLIVLKDGMVRYTGYPGEIVTSSMLKEIFEVEAEIIQNPKTKRINVLYTSSY